MIDAIKKTLLAGVGVTVVTKDKIEAALSDYVARGKVSAEEARATAHKIAEDGRKEWESASAELSRKFESLMTRANFAPRSEVQALEARVKALEEEIARVREANVAGPTE